MGGRVSVMTGGYIGRSNTDCKPVYLLTENIVVEGAKCCVSACLHNYSLLSFLHVKSVGLGLELIFDERIEIPRPSGRTQDHNCTVSVIPLLH